MMAAQDSFDYFCIALLLSYVFIALGYTLWIICYREFSEA
jgi:hypothetical protein